MATTKGWFYRHRAMIGYLFLVLVSIVAIEVHHDQTINSVKSEARETCNALATVTENQRFVMETLTELIAAETEEENNLALAPRLAQIEFRLSRLPEFDCSSSLRRVEP